MIVPTFLEEKQSPLARKIFNLIEDLKAYIKFGQEKVTFGADTDRLFSKLFEPDCQKQVKFFQKVFAL